MYTQPELDRVVATMRRCGITELDLQDRDSSLFLSLAPAATAAENAAAASPEARSETLTAASPAIGRFVARGTDDGLAVLAPQSIVHEGEILGYVATGTLRLPVPSPAGGTLCGDLPAEGRVTGFGDPLFKIEVQP